jgi:hypothetical protein
MSHVRHAYGSAPRKRVTLDSKQPPRGSNSYVKLVYISLETWITDAIFSPIEWKAKTLVLRSSRANFEFGRKENILARPTLISDTLAFLRANSNTYSTIGLKATLFRTCFYEDLFDEVYEYIWVLG